MAYETDPADIPAGVSTLRMENEDASVTFTNLGPSLSTPGL
jgi:hypothetical protein